MPAPPPAELEVSSMYVTATAAAMKTLGFWETFSAPFSEEAKAIFNEPHSRQWHRWGLLDADYDRFLKSQGAEAVHRFSYTLSANSFGPIVRPVVTLAFAMTGVSPASVLRRLDEPLKFAQRGLSTRYEAVTPNTGVLDYVYPYAVPSIAEASWAGMCDLVFELSKTTGRFARTERLADGHTLRCHVEWD